MSMGLFWRRMEEEAHGSRVASSQLGFINIEMDSRHPETPVAPEKFIDQATIAYIEQNKHRASLPKFKLEEGQPRFFPGRSAFGLLKFKLRSVRTIASGILKNTFRYSRLSRLAKLKGTGTGKSVLVLGNGPSQGFLDPKKLSSFIEQGDHLFTVNFYNNNLSLSPICPNYHVISDPIALSPYAPNRFTQSIMALREYLQKNAEITICVPMDFDLGDEFANRAIYFNDIEACWWSKNINPLFPRGYLSMTLYKALAIACFVGYDNIYVLGMDNTYPHDIFVDRQNNVCNVERHGGGPDHVTDQSPLYQGTEDVLWDLCFIFFDLQLFKDNSIVNLDPYSLTNVFPKGNRATMMNLVFDEIM